jgi:hypothetical protein
LVKVEFKGNIHFDNSEQITYWKNWATKTFVNGGKPNTFIENEEEVPF